MQARWARMLFVFGCGVAAAGAAAQNVRSVRLPQAAPPEMTRNFVASESAAMFVGVRDFTHDRDLDEVRYAVDDAVDLAYAVSLDRSLPLVAPERIALALSGKPRKETSQRRLDKLQERGASIHPAGQTDIIGVMEQQAKRVGKRGILIVGIATHGFSDDGLHYLVASNSLLRYRDSAVATHKLLDIAVRSGAPRALVFLDACRSRLTAGATRGLDEVDDRSAAPLVDGLAHSAGHVIFYAAAPGDYAYDDDLRQNGVFTSALIDGLHCGAAADEEGLVTTDALAAYVNERVRDWVQAHRHRPVAEGIQATRGSGMPVALCAPSATPARPQIVRLPGQTEIQALLQRLQLFADAKPVSVQPARNSFSVLNGAGLPLWGSAVSGDIAQTAVIDLDGDGTNEVVVGVTGSGEDVGKVLVYESSGKIRWSASTTTAFNYDRAGSGRLAVKAFASGDLYRTGRRQIVVLALDAQGWFPSRLCIFDFDGTLLASYWHPGHLHRVLVAQPSEHEAPRIIVSGVNNDLAPALGLEGYVSAVFAFDPEEISGEGPPYSGHSPKGSQLWYGVLVPSPNILERMEIVDFDQDGRNEISVWTTSQSVFYLTFDGLVRRVARGDSAKPGESTQFYLLKD
jgi:hypothetical protein